MPLAQLSVVPLSRLALTGWAFANTVSHRDIIRRVFETRGVKLIEYPLEPFDPGDPAGLAGFLNAHQDMHSAMDRALGLASYNLSEVDWQDESALAQWMNAHFVEHQAASQLLGVS